MKKNKIKAPIVFYVAIAMLCVTLVSMNLTGGLFAKYTTRADGDDSGNVAAYNVTVSDLSEKDLTLDSYDKGALLAETAFTVTSASEVAVRYSVIVTLNTPLPTEYTRDETGKLSDEPTEYISIKLRDEADVNRENMREPVISQDRCTFTFADVGEFAPGGASAEHLLVFEIFPGNHGADFVLSGINVRVDVVQID